MKSSKSLISKDLQNIGRSYESIIAWSFIFALFLVTIVGSLIGAGSILRFAFPCGALLVGFLLYCRYPLLYVGFTWWLWFLTPLLRRIADYYSQYDPQGIMLTAPYLVTGLASLTFLRQFPKASQQGTYPFGWAVLAVFYSIFIGIINNPVITVARTAIAWLPPIFFGFHLSNLWWRYPELRKLMANIFLGGVLVMGTYGIFQYIIAPSWDREWLINVDMTSFGRPEPQQIRVWSTMNSPVSFASTMLAGLILLLIGDNSFLRIPAAMTGYLSFLLSSVRAVWGGWTIAILIFMISLKESLQIRLIVTIGIATLFVYPLISLEPFSEVVGDRLGTFSAIKTDSSFQARVDTYSSNLDIALSQVLGMGLGSTRIIGEGGQTTQIAFDSGILDMLFTLGWLGTIPYMLGIILLLSRQFQGRESRFDHFASACRAIVTSHVVVLSLGNFMIDAPGFVLWSFLGLGLAAHKFFLAQGGGEV